MLLVSIADKLHNVRALATDSRAVGDALWRRFNPEAGRDGTLGYYRGLVIAYSHRIKHVGDSRLPFLVEALEREVSTLEARVERRRSGPRKQVAPILQHTDLLAGQPQKTLWPRFSSAAATAFSARSASLRVESGLIAFIRS